MQPQPKVKKQDVPQQPLIIIISSVKNECQLLRYTQDFVGSCMEGIYLAGEVLMNWREFEC